MTVTVQSALTEVQASARRLRELVRELVLTAVEDQPSNCQAHLVMVVHDAALDATAEAEQAAAALDLEQTADIAPPHAVTPHEIAHCQHHVSLLGAVLVRQLAAPELLNDLAVLGREHGREVRAWVRPKSAAVSRPASSRSGQMCSPRCSATGRNSPTSPTEAACPATDADLEMEGTASPMPKLTITVFLSPNDEFNGDPDPSWPTPQGVTLQLTNTASKKDAVDLDATDSDGITSSDKLAAGATYEVEVLDGYFKGWTAAGDVSVGS